MIATARSGSDAPGLSRAGSVMGTPAYMAPEQARGEIDRIDERADVFALGSILCEILTGEPAFLGRSSGEILRKAALGDTADALARLDACGADAELIASPGTAWRARRRTAPRHAGAVAERVTAYLAGVQDRLRRRGGPRRRVGRARRRSSRARSERRARQFQVGLAASLRCSPPRAASPSPTCSSSTNAATPAFAQVLAEATALRDKALREPGEPAAWHDAADRRWSGPRARDGRTGSRPCAARSGPGWRGRARRPAAAEARRDPGQ